MKPKSLDKIKKEVDGMKDKLGKSVDTGIRDLVIGLRRWGINTSQSCEGHEDEGHPYPWVSIPYNQAEEISKLVGWQNRPVLPNGKENKNRQ